MDLTTPRVRWRPGRLLCAGLLMGAACVGLGGALSSSAASADEGATTSSGLLGAVGGALAGAGETLADVGGAAAQTASTLTEATQPVTQPVLEIVPAPVAPIVEQTTATVDESASALDGTLTAVSDLDGSGVVTQVVAPVVETGEALPVVGRITASVGLGPSLTGVTAALDDLLAALAGAAPTTGAVLPPLPDHLVPMLWGGAALPLGAPPSTERLLALSPQTRDASAAGTAVSRASAPRAPAAVDPGDSAPTAPSLPSHRDGPGGEPPGAPAAPAPSGSAHGAGGGGAGAAFIRGAPPAADLAMLATRNPSDDALPGAPTFGTDVSPD